MFIYIISEILLLPVLDLLDLFLLIVSEEGLLSLNVPEEEQTDKRLQALYL